MTVTYRPAPAVQRIAGELIAEHHSHLTDVDVRYVFRSEHAKSSGKAVFGRAKKIGGLNAYLAQLEDPDETGIEGNDGDFFVIEIAEDIWAELSNAQRVALVDHELSHCTINFDKDGLAKLSCKPHDLEEFNAVVARHGLWRPDVTEFAKTLQLRLDGTSTFGQPPDRILCDDKTGSAGPEHEPGPGSDAPSDGRTDGAPSDEWRTEEQETSAVDAPSSANGESRPSLTGPDADAPAPSKATPAQRLALARHIGALDESLTDEYLAWCKRTATPANPEHMTFEQARAALLLMGEREAVATR